MLSETYKVGTKILKGFKSGTLYKREVTRYRDIYYKIKYDDGDEEEMEHEEVYKHLKA